MVKGMPKSGKFWKVDSTPFRTMDEEYKQFLPKITFEQKLKRKQEMLEARELEKKLAQEKTQAKHRKKQQKQKSLKDKEAKQFKSSTYQVVKDTNKVKKMNKKIRQQLQKMPTEMFYKVVHGKELI